MMADSERLKFVVVIRDFSDEFKLLVVVSVTSVVLESVL